MSPTYEVEPRFWRDFDRLTAATQRQFLAARQLFIEGLRENPPRFAPALRAKRVQGHPDVWEMTFAADVWRRHAAPPSN